MQLPLRSGQSRCVADSVDFLEDTSVNGLILIALGWSAASRGRLGKALAAILLIPGLATLWTAANKLLTPATPAPLLLSLTGLGALAVNFSCALLLARHRHHVGSLSRATFLSARNDVIANIAIIMAGGVTSYWSSPWPDLIVGIGIAIMNADAARDVWIAASKEHIDALP